MRKAFLSLHLDSDPAAEWTETQDKSRPLIEALSTAEDPLEQ